MPLHRLTAITLGVPDVSATAAYYADFGLTPLLGGGEDTAASALMTGAHSH